MRCRYTEGNQEMTQDLYNEAFEAGMAAERAEWQKPVPMSDWERLTKIEAAARNLVAQKGLTGKRDIAYKKLEELLK